MKLFLYTRQLDNKGFLAYEYNPLRNLKTSVDLYLVEGYIIPEGKGIDKRNGNLLILSNESDDEKIWKDQNGNIIDNIYVLTGSKEDIVYKAGSLIDFDTPKLNFDLEHPVEIEVLPSYDGSVNLILTDNKNVPRLINTRFAPKTKNTYEIIDRIGTYTTNVYSEDNLDKTTSLYFLYNKNPIIKYRKLCQGNLLVGQYCFYLTYADEDNNESDICAETGVIPVFKGHDEMISIDGGIKNENSLKGISLEISNLDTSYNYFKLYYVRYFADYQLNRVYEGKKLIDKFPVTHSNITITGVEPTEDIDPNILNISRFNPKTVLTLAQCRNMLFSAHIHKNTDNYKELRDLALRLCPYVTKENIAIPNHSYNISSSPGYYSSNNYYNKVGYHNKEYYRFGVVFIYNNGTISSVYNTLGYEITNITPSQVTPSDIYNEKVYTKLDITYTRNYITYDDINIINGVSNKIKSNSVGVVKLDLSTVNADDVYAINFFTSDVKGFRLALEYLGIRGMFFVRLKRIPTILGQCYTLPYNKYLEAPVLSDGEKCYIEILGKKEGTKFVYSEDYNLKEINGDNNDRYMTAICPDFSLNLPYYNLLFNGSKFKLRRLYKSKLKTSQERIYSEEFSNPLYLYDEITEAVIYTVTENVPSIAIDSKVFKLDKGVAQDLTKYNSSKKINEDKDIEETDYIRGSYSPFLAIKTLQHNLRPNTAYEILINDFDNTEWNIKERAKLAEPYYAISEKLDVREFSIEKCFKGDCFINLFTHRLNRNFNDPTLPNNDKIANAEKKVEDVWKDQRFNCDKIPRAEINAVKLGTWITIKVRSSCNYAFRSEDLSYVSERAIMGASRSYFPKSTLLENGVNKMPDSYLYNDAFRATLGYKCYFPLDNMNFIKNNFSNRIQYSSLQILDSYKNNYRESLSTYYQDYSNEYGSITKLISFDGYLLIVLEHGIGIATINERVLAGQGLGEPVFINTQNVLPEELTIISDTIGSLWGDSVIKTESGAVYGVDTITKKIWRVSGNSLEIISDFKVGGFLNNNITLTERELNPIIGLKNVKTHYNNNKKDVMFTFYDNVTLEEEKVWNLCFNELLNIFTTFYSWVPSYSANIDTQYFSFDRNTSKLLGLLEKTNANIEDNSGVLLDYPLLDVSDNKEKVRLYYKPLVTTKYHKSDTDIEIIKEKLDISDKVVEFKILPDRKKYYKYFRTVKENNQWYLICTDYYKVFPNGKNTIITLTLLPTAGQTIFKSETIAISNKYTVNNLTTDFYLHGDAGIIDLRETIRPTYWYDELHPFEFEVCVNENIGLLKIFTNMMLIANKAEPESFHFEIEGDNYEFSTDKRNMFFRQEKTKKLFQENGSDVLYCRDFEDIKEQYYLYEQYYRNIDLPYIHGMNYPIESEYPIIGKKLSGLTQLKKSTVFPLYYKKIDTYNDIYYHYREMLGDGNYDFKNLSGSEIKWNRRLNLFNIVTHIKNSPIDLYGRLRGNSFYKEGVWNIQIPSITFSQSNEKKWEEPPILFDRDYILDSDIQQIKLPNTMDINKYISTMEGWTKRKETRIRDKWIKIRIRYSGKNLAVIHSLLTFYNISFS